MWAGLTSGDWSIARLTIIDPLIVAAVCIAVAFAFPEQLRRALRSTRNALLRIPAPLFVGAVALVIIASGTIIAHLAYGGQPALTDELSQAFQGRILLSGRLWAVPETYREFFETPQTVNRYGRWFSQYPIGSGALSAIADGTRLGSIINPLLLALAAIATWSFARRAYDETTARIAAILIALSPFAVFMSATRMNHVPTLTLTAVALAALTHWTHATTTRQRALSAAAIGAAIGAIVLIRPYDAALIALPIGLFQIAHASSRFDSRPYSRSFSRSLAVQILTASIIVAIQFYVNSRTTGNWFLFGYDALNGAAHRPGFHTNPLGFPFTPSDGLDFITLYLTRLNTSLFESAIPSLVFITGALWLAKPTRYDWLLIGLILSLLAGYGAYWFDGVFNGPRFLYPALIAFSIFTARFVRTAANRHSRIALGAALSLPVCLALALVPASIGNRSTGVSLRLKAMIDRPDTETENPASEARTAGLTNALVLVREPLHSRITARMRALGMAPFDAERTVADLDACALLTALGNSDAHPERPPSDRLATVFKEAQAAGQGRLVPGLYGNAALALVNGQPSSAECYREIVEDSVGTGNFSRFLASSTIDSTGRIGGDVVFARTLGARDSILLTDPRFARRTWYIYRRSRGEKSGRFERIR